MSFDAHITVSPLSSNFPIVLFSISHVPKQSPIISNILS